MEEIDLKEVPCYNCITYPLCKSQILSCSGSFDIEDDDLNRYMFYLLFLRKKCSLIKNYLEYKKTDQLGKLIGQIFEK